MPGRPIRRSADLAALLRQQIATGERGPGARMPSERDLQQTYGLARDTVRAAVAALAAEGLIVVRQGYPSRVRVVADKQRIVLEPGQRVETRMPTPDEREEFQIDTGIPVMLVIDADGFSELYPGDRFTIAGSES